ncbi:flavin reductase family protein [Streptomyces sp. NPDC058470]|uniref:flavin reductase family protein n=1 Tax=Streptomyces sp. NPDC058470 TaxID=3346515 RepID=UPI0036462867
MYYEVGVTDHGLAHNPFKAICVPRPIGWISTLDRDGRRNLAPFSQSQNMAFDPPTVSIAINQRETDHRKDTVQNIEATGEFVWNMATYELREAVNFSGRPLPHGDDEFDYAGVTAAESRVVKAPRVAESPVNMECRYVQTVRIPGNADQTTDLVIARVVAIHIADEAISDGMLDVLKIRPLARLGYNQYTSVESVFTMTIPGGNSDLASGLEGRG